MKTVRILAAICLALAIQFSAFAQKTEKYHFKHQGIDRTYWMFIPEGLPAQAPLLRYNKVEVVEEVAAEEVAEVAPADSTVAM